ncbi:hypothetical protein LTR36_002491 [Oleoguttula mirabilis]|uniref:Leucine rich repeat protein n=1 Tax=Oleoguttula mirabilis TaxID=1507867 RepID=A0AAV9JKC4_9PEZI|nr:hypothetical protein LTR36_002491 [Oleoguttula mirabilis]
MTKSGRLLGNIKHSWVFANLPTLLHKARCGPVAPSFVNSSAEDESDPVFSFALTRPAEDNLHDSNDTSTCDSEPGEDMGKSNKFDFTNRPSSGVKLGNSISSLLTKEADKVINKARKQSTDSSAGSSEKEPPSHHVDLQAPNKALGDDGVCALADGLEVALRSGTSLTSLALEDLNLSGNSVTTAGLARLAPVIELAKYDLKTLNLSNNHVKVATDEEAEQWEAFLLAFKHCYKLRRLDLSGNTELGGRAVEIFARVHINEPAISPVPSGGDGSVLSLLSEKADEDDAASISGETGEDAEEDNDLAMAKSLSDARFLRRRCGLRSIPYITLHQTGLTDASALWLSYVVEDHYFPNQLTDDLNGIQAGSAVKAYQQGESNSGVDWANNKTTLGKDGLALLQKTDVLRRQTMLDDQSTLAGSLVVEVSMAGCEAGWPDRRMSTERRYSRSLPGHRRASIRSIHTIDGGEHEASELDSARRKIQRHLIEHDKASSVELWHIALRIVKYSRALLILAPPVRTSYFGDPIFNTLRQPTITHVSREVMAQANGHPQKLSIDTGKASRNSRGSYAATLTATSSGVPGEPELALTEVTNSPTTPKMIFKPHRKGAFSEGCDLPAVTQRLDSLILRDDSPERFVEYQQNRIMSATGGKTAYRDVSIPSHLPHQVVEYILSFIMTRKEREVLSAEQKRAAFAWGQEKLSLKTELEWRKKDEASQVWMMLDSINCLTYGQ